MKGQILFSRKSKKKYFKMFAEFSPVNIALSGWTAVIFSLHSLIFVFSSLKQELGP